MCFLSFSFVTGIKAEFKDVSTELNHAQQVLMSKEQELQQNSVMARQQLWKQSSEHQEEKYSLIYLLY